MHATKPAAAFLEGKGICEDEEREQDLGFHLVDELLQRYTVRMESVTLSNVRDLPGDEKRSLENLLKQPLEEGQRVFIMTFRPGVVPGEATRLNAHAALLHTLDEAHAHARAQGVTTEEADAAVEEAMRQVRPRSS